MPKEVNTDQPELTPALTVLGVLAGEALKILDRIPSQDSPKDPALTENPAPTVPTPEPKVD